MTSPSVSIKDITTGQIQVITGGLIGPQGPQGPGGGPQGPQGEQGSTGATGPIGPQGPQGPVGGSGAQGAQGPTGPQGGIGPQGAQGPTGPQGPQGRGGSAGLDGAQGPQGPRGAIGVQGPQGAQGAGGSTGVQGPAGPQGVQGSRGNTGPQGPVGPQGYQGAKGDEGPQGATGAPGTQGPRGYQGSVGADGQTGPQGPIGPQGYQGPVGPQGYQGELGPQGPAGPAGGPQGPQGEVGNPGIVIIEHGTDGTIARPDSGVVYWIGSAVPLNAQETDFWYGDASAQPQSFGSTLNFANSYTDEAVAALSTSYIASSSPAVGEFAPPRTQINDTYVPSYSGDLVGPVFKADKTETISTISVYSGSNVTATSPTLCRVGVYRIDPATSDATLVASGANDTTLFAATETEYAVSLESPFTKQAGTDYWVAVLVVASGTPNYIGWTLTEGPDIPILSSIFNVSPALSYVVSGLSDLPDTIAASALNNSTTNIPLFRLW